MRYQVDLEVTLSISAVEIEVEEFDAEKMAELAISRYLAEHPSARRPTSETAGFVECVESQELTNWNVID